MNSANRLYGKSALVTGGSRGIGAAIVNRLASEGAHVALTYASSPDRAGEVAKAAQALGVKSLAIQADSADSSAVAAAVERTVAELGGIDILVNNAGVLAIGPIDDFTLADFDRTFAVNVRAVFVATQAAVKHMMEGGRIINIGSCNAERMPFGGGAVYAMSKSALHGLVKGLARDLGARGITINNVQPGPTDTEMNPASGESAEMLKGFMALPRYGTVEDKCHRSNIGRQRS
jgi:3-oxoacyl-[acyl-carrier protein] reductase